MSGVWHCDDGGPRRAGGSRRAGRRGAVRSAPAAGRNRARMTSSGEHAIVGLVDQDALERARERLDEAAQGKAQPSDVEAALERARAQVEALAATAAEFESTLPDRVGEA